MRIRMSYEMADNRRTDKTGAAGYKYCRHIKITLSRKPAKLPCDGVYLTSVWASRRSSSISRAR